MNKLSYGTYLLNDKDLFAALRMSYEQGFRNFDTAKLYKNENIIGLCFDDIIDLKEDIWITTKIYEYKLKNIDQIIRIVKDRVKLLNPSNNEHIKIRVLIHKPEPVTEVCLWKALEICLSLKIVDDIGVSNYNIEALRNLMSFSTFIPSCNQIELHPFLPKDETRELLNFCYENNIKIEAHTALTKGVHLKNEELINKTISVSENIHMNLTPVQYLIAWVLSNKAVNQVCIKSSKKEHLEEIIRITKCLPFINDKHYFKTKARFCPYNMNDFDKYDKFCKNTPSMCNRLQIDLQNLKNGITDDISNLALFLPLTKSKISSLGRWIAILMFPSLSYPNLDVSSKYQKYTNLIKPLRKFCISREEARLFEYRKNILSGKTCSLNNRKKKNIDIKENKVSDLILNPTPMPVEISSEESLRSIFNFLKENKETINLSNQFFKGAMFKDGRIDMCKQVVGPTYIGDLCDAVTDNENIKHFLLGNNIAFQDKPEYAEYIAKIMASNQPIETWYLAGNCIDDKALNLICDGLKKNNVCKALWLKRNPIGPKGCNHLAKLLSENKTLSLLDLHNCGILDEGLGELAKAENCYLKHVYLDANAISSKGCQFISPWLKQYKDVIKTFYMSINRIGDKGAIDITNALQGSKSLRSICLASNRLTDKSLSVIVDNMLSCENLICLDLGFYKSTFDLGEKPNFFTNVDALKKLLQEHKNLEHLDVNMNQFKDEDILQLVELAKEKNITIVANKLLETDKSEQKIKYHYISPKHDKNQGLKFIKHPKKVMNIMSIYRNKL